MTRKAEMTLDTFVEKLYKLCSSEEYLVPMSKIPKFALDDFNTFSAGFGKSLIDGEECTNTRDLKKWRNKLMVQKGFDYPVMFER